MVFLYCYKVFYDYSMSHGDPCVCRCANFMRGLQKAAVHAFYKGRRLDEQHRARFVCAARYTDWNAPLTVMLKLQVPCPQTYRGTRVQSVRSKRTTRLHPGYLDTLMFSSFLRSNLKSSITISPGELGTPR